MPDPIERELIAAQAAYLLAPKRRTAAVLTARNAGWSMYRMAKALHVDESTVRAILRAAEKNGIRP